MARQRNGKWQADTKVAGKRIRVSFNTLAEAVSFEARPFAIGNATVGEFFVEAYEFMWRRTKNARTAWVNTQDLITIICAGTPVAAIDEPLITSVISRLRAKGNSDKTINRKLACLSKILKHARKCGHIKEVPHIEYFKESKGRIRFLTQDEEQSIFESLSPHHRCFAEFLLYTGCRVGEALKLQWKDVSDSAVTFWDTKGGTNRTIPLTNRAKAALQCLAKAPTPWSTINYDGFHRDWTEARNLAGLTHDPHIVPHVLRHTCCSRLVQAGVDIRRIKEWMGHSSIQTTMLYAHLAPNDLMSVADALNGTGLAQVA